MKRAILALLGLLTLAAPLLVWPVLARADAASPWYVTPQGRVRLIAAEPVPDAAAKSVTLGLEFALAPHWKIYWRSPGDAGYPPALDWQGSQNLDRATMAWPVPERFSVLGLETIGYSGTVVLPITASLKQPGAPLKLRAHLAYLTCSEICVPHETDLALDLPAASSKEGGEGYAALIAQYQAIVPDDGAASGIALVSAVLHPGTQATLDLTVASAQPLVAPDAFIEGPDNVTFAAPRLVAQKAGEAVLRLAIDGDWRAVPGRKLGVTLVDGPRFMAGTVAPREGRGLADMATLAAMLGIALLGGLILNLMPCVLPVLSLKLLAALPKPGTATSSVRAGFLGTAAGIVVSFLGFAAIVLALRSAGIAIGWGAQFQDPVFLIFLVIVLTLFAANLWGAFDLPLPPGVAAIAARGPLGSFATGIFATLLATPCSAPFLGTALGFALAAGPLEIVTVFAALGLGMALPYLAVAALPGAARLLPRPGPWMLPLRRGLGVLLIGTALWLLAILGAEAGWRAMLAVALLLTFAALVLAVLREGLSRWALIGIAFAAAFAVPALAPPPGIAVLANDGPWQPFDAAAIGGLVRDGQVVFVDVTADWCLTCKVNERLVLGTDPVRSDLAHRGVIAMRADWTRPNPAIAAYLSRFGRYGIPFNAVYGPAAPGGLALPELLTPGAVTTALAEAAGRSLISPPAR